MAEFQIPPPNADALPAADVSAAAIGGSVEYEAFPVRKPEEDLSDFKVQVRASTLARCRTQLSRIRDPGTPWHEVCLGLSTLSAGAYLGALPSQIDSKSWLYPLFNTLLPAIACAAFVGYVLLRRSASNEPAAIVSDVLQDLPNPERTR